MDDAPRSQRVLVVDDDMDARELLVELLQTIGIDALGARDGFAALERVEDFSPDVLLLDLSMPGMSGFEVAARVLGRAGPRRPRIIVVTAFAEPELHARALALGCEAVLVKPVPPERLLGALRRASGDRR